MASDLNSTVGTITAEGLYQAPATTPESPEIIVGATISTVKNKNLWATVLFDGKRPDYKTESEWGESKDNLKYLKKPMAIALEREGNILIADGKINRFSNKGIFIDEIGESKGEYKGSLTESLNVTVNNEGLIFVSDLKTAPERIQAFAQDGRYLYGFASKGTGDGRVMDSRGMAINSKQQLYIGDIDNMRVSVFGQSGDFIQTIGKKGAFPGDLNAPYGLALDSNDDLFVINYFGPCQKFTPDGHFLFDFAFPNPPEGLVYLTDIASDSWGNVYIIVKGTQKSGGQFDIARDDIGNSAQIMKFNNNGDYITNIQLAKNNRNALRLTVDRFGKIFVLFEDEEMKGVEIISQ